MSDLDLTTLYVELEKRVRALEGRETPIERQALFTVDGALIVEDNPLKIYNNTGMDLTITRVHLAVDTAPTGAAIIVDIHKNGTTIFTNPAHRAQIAAGATNGETTDIDVATWTAGEYLTAHVDQVGSTLAGEDIVICVVSF